MKFVPNRTKICTRCHNVVLYNQKYVGMDILNDQGEVETIIQHYDIGGCLPPLTDVTPQMPPQPQPYITPYPAPSNPPYISPSVWWNATNGTSQAAQVSDNTLYYKAKKLWEEFK